MIEYEFLYEDEVGSIRSFRCKARTLLDAEDVARRECPDAVDCCIEICENGTWQ